MLIKVGLSKGFGYKCKQIQSREYRISTGEVYYTNLSKDYVYVRKMETWKLWSSTKFDYWWDKDYTFRNRLDQVVQTRNHNPPVEYRDWDG